MREAGKFENRMLFIMGFLVGVTCFIAVYGIKVLNVTYDAWIFHGDIDLQQHYLGWCHFRTTPWQFPVGLIDSLSYPHSMSVVWTDSIPVMALICKLFRTALPETFQYFGWFALISFGLQGGISALLTRKITHNKIVCFLMVLPFVLSFPILQRTFYHTSLCAHWIILLAVYIWFSDIQRSATWKKCIIWASMGTICVLIHSYFLPMVGIVMGACLVEELIRIKKWWPVILQGVSFCSSAIAALYFLGAFYGSVSTDYTIGGFESNLNTLFNSMGLGKLLKGFAVYGDFQHEGFGYLGAGMIMLIVIGSILMAVKMYAIGETVQEWRRRTILRPRRLLVFLITILFFCMAVLPYVTIGSRLLFKMPFPDFLNRLLGVFRSNGRFIWPVVYLLMLAGIYGVSKFKKRGIALVVIAVCIVVQMYDISPYMLNKRENFAKTEATYNSFWDKKEMNDVIGEYRHFVITFDDVTTFMDTASYAYDHQMTLNRFYYARNNEKDVNRTLENYLDELNQGKSREDCIYVFDEETYLQNANAYLNFYTLGDVVIGVSKEINGLEKAEQK